MVGSPDAVLQITTPVVDHNEVIHLAEFISRMRNAVFVFEKLWLTANKNNKEDWPFEKPLIEWLDSFQNLITVDDLEPIPSNKITVKCE